MIFVSNPDYKQSLDFSNSMFSNNQALQLKVKKMYNPAAENAITREKQLHWNALVI